MHEKTNKTIEMPVIFEDGKTHVRGTRQINFTCRDRVRDIDHSHLSISIFLN